MCGPLPSLVRTVTSSVHIVWHHGLALLEPLYAAPCVDADSCLFGLRTFVGAGKRDEKALDEIIDTILEKGVETFLPQALSNVTWGCATLEHNNEAFLQVSLHHI